MNVLISGGSGLVGRRLTELLTAKGYTVALLGRSARSANPVKTYIWDIDRGHIDQDAIAFADYIIHLAGENIGGRRWTESQKKKIISSRVRSAELLFEAVKASEKKPLAFVSASAIGYYGAVTADIQFVEDDIPGTDFLGTVCRLWEQAAERFSAIGVRTVRIRNSVVLSAEAPALQKMAAPVRLGLGAAIGSGQQFFPCIHIDDLCAVYQKALEDASMQGAYNAAMPEQTTNRDFMRSLARVLQRPFFMPAVPEFLMELLFGEMASAMLRGSRVSVNRLLATGFSFKFEKVEDALKDVFEKVDKPARA